MKALCDKVCLQIAIWIVLSLVQNAWLRARERGAKIELTSCISFFSEKSHASLSITLCTKIAIFYRRKRSCRPRWTCSRSSAQSRSAVTCMASSTTWWSCLRSVDARRIRTICSWAITSIEATIALRLWRYWSAWKCALRKESRSCEAITRVDRSHKSTASTTSASASTATRMCGNTWLISLTTYRWQLLWRIKFSACTADSRPLSTPWTWSETSIES